MDNFEALNSGMIEQSVVTDFSLLHAERYVALWPISDMWGGRAAFKEDETDVDTWVNLQEHILFICFPIKLHSGLQLAEQLLFPVLVPVWLHTVCRGIWAILQSAGFSFSPSLCTPGIMSGFVSAVYCTAFMLKNPDKQCRFIMQNSNKTKERWSSAIPETVC